jgi:hypothetical protein
MDTSEETGKTAKQIELLPTKRVQHLVAIVETNVTRAFEVPAK